MAFNYDAFLRMEQMPHIWCPGCGHGMVMKSLIRAIHKTGWDPNKVLVVSGIGCAGRIATYLNFDTVHTTHGRALPFATGAKLANPDLHVIIATGDGDALAIGGNHFIHACRRNIDMTMVIFNNGIYGMTGGQYSPHHALRRPHHHQPLRQRGTSLRHLRLGRGQRRGFRCARGHLPAGAVGQDPLRRVDASQLQRGRGHRGLFHHPRAAQSPTLQKQHGHAVGTEGQRRRGGQRQDQHRPQHALGD